MLWRMWSSLNQIEIEPDDSRYSDAERRILARLGDYAALLVGPLNMRPKAAALHARSAERIEVRVSTPSQHVLLVIAPEADLAPEVAWLRALAGARLAIPRLLAHDLSCATVPFTYAIESYTTGGPLDWLEDSPRIRVAARQVGRTLRRAHQTPAAGFGRPSPAGRWSARSWPDALRAWLAPGEALARAGELLGGEGLAALRVATLDHPTLACERPQLLHGAPEPARVLVTIGDTVQVEALTRPGELIGGDPLFDLAYTQLARYPEAFRQGAYEGYTALGPLDAAQEGRLRRLGLLLQLASALREDDPAAIGRLPDLVACQLRELG